MFERQPQHVKTCFKCGKETTQLFYIEVPGYGHGWVCQSCKQEVEKK